VSRSVLVTGGNRGIGLTVAQSLAAAGHKVAVTQHSSEAPDGLLAVKCDVSDPADTRAAVATVTEEHGPVEILVCCAGITRDGLMVRMADEDWYDVIATNLTGSWTPVRAVLPSMLRGRWGRIVLMSSSSGLLGSAGQANYAAAKAGLVGLARSVAREYGSRDITANVVAPGLIETDMATALTDDQRAAIVDATPARRIGTTAEVAAAVNFLVSDEAGYVNGAVLPVDGGLGMGH